MPGGEGRDLAFPREHVLVPWLLLEDVWGQHRGDLGLQAEQLGSMFLFYFAPLGETQPLLRRGVSSRDGAWRCPGFRGENQWCCSTVTKCGGVKPPSQVLCECRDPAPMALPSPPELSVQYWWSHRCSCAPQGCQCQWDTCISDMV